MKSRDGIELLKVTLQSYKQPLKRLSKLKPVFVLKTNCYHPLIPYRLVFTLGKVIDVMQI